MLPTFVSICTPLPLLLSGCIHDSAAFLIVTMSPESSRPGSNELITSASHSSTNRVNTAIYSSEAPIDLASHDFDPPWPAIERAHECQRCNLMVAVVYWYKDKNIPRGHFGAQFYVLHRTRGDLEDGIRKRCWWCLRLETSLSSTEKEKNCDQVIKEADSNRGVFLVFELSTISPSWFYIYIKRTPRQNLMCEFDLKMKSYNYWITNKALEECWSYTGGPATWCYVKVRLDNCARNYPECRYLNPWVPTRLVEVRMMGSTLQLGVVLTEKWTEKKRYISLSHR